MTFPEIARLVLAESLLPLSAEDVWKEVIRKGLDKQVKSSGKTPHHTLGAYLYTAARKSGSGIIAVGKEPVRFQWVGEDTPVATKKEPKASKTDTKKEKGGKFLVPCLEVLSAHAPTPMGVADILKGILAAHPELPWKNSNGAVRAALLRAAKAGIVGQVSQAVPPQFFVVDAVPSVPPAPTKTTFSFLACAEKVLREFGEKKPMHYRAITAKAIEQGWLVSDGETPETTMNAQIGSDIRRRQAGRKQQIFVQHGKGFIGLSEWMSHGIRFQAEEHNKSVMAKMLKRLHSISPQQFENLVRALLEAMDFVDTTVTSASGDGGIDVRGTWRVADGIEIRMAIQAKRWKANVQSPVVQAVRGSLTGSERGMIITTSDFSKGAQEEAADPRKASTISLVNGEQLVKLLVQYGVGVKSDAINILELDPEAEWFSAKG